MKGPSDHRTPSESNALTIALRGRCRLSLDRLQGLHPHGAPTEFPLVDQLPSSPTPANRMPQKSEGGPVNAGDHEDVVVGYGAECLVLHRCIVAEATRRSAAQAGTGVL